MGEPRRDILSDSFWEGARARTNGMPDFHLPSLEVFLNIIYTFGAIQEPLARRFAKYGISLSAWEVLMLLNRCEGKRCAQHRLGSLLMVSRANVTGLVDRLEKRGLVRRETGSTDRRLRWACLTPEGESLIHQLLPGHHRALRRLMAGLEDSEKAELVRLLGRLRQAALQAGSEEAEEDQ